MAGDLALALLSPQEVSVPTQSGKEKTFILSKIPAVMAREIMAKYPTTFLPKLGDYDENRETMFKLMSYVGVPLKDGVAPLRLTTEVLINNHVPDWECLGHIELAMLRYNSSFFLQEKALTFFDVITEKIMQRVTEILTASLRQSSTQEKPPSEN